MTTILPTRPIVRTLAFALAVAGLIAVAPDRASAQTDSVTTELTKGRCKFIDDDGEVGHYALKRCPGPNGMRVYTEATMQRVALSFQFAKSPLTREVTRTRSLGEKIEWRGHKGKKGFEPEAALVRLIVADDDDQRYNVLAVIRIQGILACVMAVVDEAANAEATALARKAADAPGDFSCEMDKPKILGTETRWAKAAIGQDGAPPR
jgi:hypothetical protein